MQRHPGLLIAFGGLPGTGKTTLAQAIAPELSATYLRIDAIEQALRSSGTLAGDVGPAGYVVAYALAESNLLLGRTVIADSVNPVAASRQAWRRVAATTSSAIIEIEVICSDATEHRRRVETRRSDVAGLALPSWQDVVERRYEPWDAPDIAIDTGSHSIPDALEVLRREIRRSDLLSMQGGTSAKNLHR
jgi:predicted kinase